MHTVYGISDVLPRGDNQTEGHEYHNSDAVVKTKHGRVNVNVADFYEVFQSAEDVQHGTAGSGDRVQIGLVDESLIGSPSEGRGDEVQGRGGEGGRGGAPALAGREDHPVGRPMAARCGWVSTAARPGPGARSHWRASASGHDAMRRRAGPPRHGPPARVFRWTRVLPLLLLLLLLRLGNRTIHNPI